MIANLLLRPVCCTLFLVAYLPAVLEAAPCQIPRAFVPQLGAGAEPVGAEADRVDFAQTLFTDRKTSSTARSFREELQRGNSSQALTELSRLQIADPQLLVPLANGTWGPLFLNVLQDFYLLPNSLREKLLDESSAAANRRLGEILKEQSFNQLPGFWLRYPGTEQSLQALVLMSRIQIDRGQNRSAAFWLQVVVESGESKYVRIAEQQLNRLRANGLVEGDGAAPQALTDQGVDKLGDETESPEEKSEFPKFASWTYRSSISPTLEAQIDAFQKIASDNLVSPTSPWEAAVGGGQVYQRTMRGLAAIDLDSGEASWHYPINPVLDQKLLKDRNHANVFSKFIQNPKTVGSFSSLDQSLLANLFCRDEVQTRPVTSNGRVFLVTTDETASGPTIDPGRIFGGPPSTMAAFRQGQLIALDAESGRRIWTVGRATLEQHLGEGDNGVWFYGAPCVTEQSVLAIFEWKGEIRLGRFSADTGQYLFSAPISIPEQTIDKDFIRTLWACTPIEDGGLLWTTTTTGWLLCLDETTLSVLWASRLTDQSSLRSSVGVLRGRVAALTAPAALNRRWNRSLLKLVGDRMLVLSQEAYEAILVDSQTGRRVKSIPVSDAVLLHADDEMFVLSNAYFVEGYDIRDGRQLWKRKLSDVDDSDRLGFGVLPTGRGALHKNNLLLPLSNGHLAKLDLKSGNITGSKTQLLPIDGWGRLVSTDDDQLLYVSARQVTQLSNTKPTKPAGEYLKLGRELLASGNAKAALGQAQQVVESDRDFRQAQSLAFQCLLQLARKDPENYLQQLKAAAKTDIQRVDQRVLEIELLLNDQSEVEAISMVCEVLKMPASILHVPNRPVALTASVRSPSQDAITQRPDEQIDLTVRSWALLRMTDLLSEVDPSRWPIDDLKSVPRNLLYGIRSPEFAQQVREQVAQCETSQLAFQLIQHAVQLKFAAGDTASENYEQEVRLLDNFLDRIMSQDEQYVGIPLPVLRRLISVAVAEMPKPFVTAVQAAHTFEKWSLEWPEQLREQQLQAEQDWYEAWDSGEWSAVPIRYSYSYSGAQGLSNSVSIADPRDLFLNRYLWKLGVGSPGRLFSSALISDEKSGWSLPFTKRIGSNSSRKKWVYRSGTTLLIRSSELLTAVSLLDRAVLWSIPISTPSSMSDNEPFEDYLVLGASRPATDSPPSLRILLSGNGCVCLQESDECRALDILTGNLLWKASLSEISLPVVPGPKHTLVFSDSRNTPLLVDPMTLQCQLARSMPYSMLSAIHYNESEVVVWDHLGDETPRLLWIDPFDADADSDSQQDGILKQVKLKQFEYFQFLDASTLAAINASGQLRVIDLGNGDYQDYQVPFSKSEFPGRVSQAFIAANNYYLYVGFPSSSRNIARFGGSGRKIEFADELFVLDRRSAEISAKVGSEGRASLNFQDPRFPMMLVASQPNEASRRGPLNLRCFGVNGKQLHLEGRFPFDSSVRSFGYEVKQLRSFGMTVNGASFRIQASESDAASDKNQSPSRLLKNE